MNKYSIYIDKYVNEMKESLKDELELLLIIGSSSSNEVIENWSDIDVIVVLDEYNFKTIWYNKEKVDQLGLSQSECFACISHELGHFLDPSDRWATPQQTREINADQLAVELGLGKSLQTALDKLINDN